MFFFLPLVDKAKLNQIFRQGQKRALWYAYTGSTEELTWFLFRAMRASMSNRVSNRNVLMRRYCSTLSLTGVNYGKQKERNTIDTSIVRSGGFRLCWRNTSPCYLILLMARIRNLTDFKKKHYLSRWFLRSARGHVSKHLNVTGHTN